VGSNRLFGSLKRSGLEQVSDALAVQRDWQSFLEEQGFAVVPAVLNVRGLIPILVSLADLAPLPGRAGMRHVLSHPTVGVIARNSQLLEMAQRVLGKSAFPFRATLFDKPPDATWLVNWHQDTALPLQEKVETAGWGPWSVKEGVIYAHAPAGALEQVLALRLHLDDCTEESGPLRVIPGTHGLGVLSGADIERHSTYKQPVDCLVARGGVVALRPLAIHASSKSRSKASRRVLHIEYAATRQLPGNLQLAIA
jgi:ectoine hydroxylase-related dioxygenase (phytanoyl-CoA dioxygenase family)